MVCVVTSTYSLVHAQQTEYWSTSSDTQPSDYAKPTRFFLFISRAPDRNVSLSFGLLPTQDTFSSRLVEDDPTFSGGQLVLKPYWFCYFFLLLLNVDVEKFRFPQRWLSL